MTKTPIGRIKEAVATILDKTGSSEIRIQCIEIMMALRDMNDPHQDVCMGRKFRKALDANPSMCLYGPFGIQGLIGCKKGFIERELRRMKREGIEVPAYYCGEKAGQ